MRLITFDAGQGGRPGVQLDDATLLDLDAALAGAPAIGQAPFGSLHALIGRGAAALRAVAQLCEMAAGGKLDAARLRLADVRLLAPIPRPAKNVFCVGRNYVEHIAEGARAQKIDLKLPEYPVFFSKPPTAVIGPGDAIPVQVEVSTKVDYEVELAVVIGKPGRNIRAADALDHVFGYTIVNDVTARDLQRRHGGQFLKGKGLDGSCPMGPAIVTRDAIADPGRLAIRLWVNDELRQDGNTRDMIFPIGALIESLSEGLTLEPGDLLATGTPSGVGYAMSEPQFLKQGDVVTCEVEGIGRLVNPVTEIRA
ncbi:MAG TPA: fumarylacetoacetate hydrolase family protein [Geminicoccaceae bacterium]|nr:fumarylacetoacetate hydrolase family protein [Geminicoccaceae bacterium]